MSADDFAVVWPLGRRSRKAPPAGGITPKKTGPIDLNSSRVAFVWTYARKGDQMYGMMQEALRGEYPDIAFIGYDTFGNIHGATEAEVVAALPGLLREHKADVAVIGIAG